MANQLILFMHPDEASFNGALLKTYQEELEALGGVVKLRHVSALELRTDLTKEEYEDSQIGRYPPAVVKEQEWISWADTVTLIFPLWWGSFPASGKAYLDRVLSYKFAYEMKGEEPVPLIKGKKLAIIYTTGTPEGEFLNNGGKQRTEEVWREDIFAFCGFKCLPFLHLGNAVQAEGEEREAMFQKVREYAAQINETKPGTTP
ncbi:NAD(P)H-dependent oxidoreductase [Alteribacillus sp. HJP-4]|uniref:NAD(P)H-dependent oxidoreductase n=1 Tax=Alteribacillus sp. HJP-4 TaxID=2775394 RepID=UPI0035CD349F